MRRELSIAVLVVGSLVLALLLGQRLGLLPGGSSGLSGVNGDGYEIDPAQIVFQDDLSTNVDPPDSLSTLEFTDRNGVVHPLEEYLGERALILVITRGYAGSICPYCTAQVSGLISNYSKFQEQGAEVVVVYPLEKSSDVQQFDQLLARAKATNPGANIPVPFPVLFDVELKAVNALGIQKELSKPATYLFDASKQLRFAYVGNTLADRPSVKSLLDQLSRLPQQTPEG